MRPAFVLWLLTASLCALAGEPILRQVSGTPDPAAADGEAKTLDRAGIYCWWVSPPVKPGYFEIVVRARTVGEPGVIQFVLTDAADEERVFRAISETQMGRVESAGYAEVYCGTFYWDGSFGFRVSDWSSPGLMVDWVSLREVTVSEVRDPLPGAVKRYDAPRLPERPRIDGELDEWARVPMLQLGQEAARSAAYGGTADLSALARLAWDAWHLYIACEVVDDVATFLQDTRHLGDLWKFDSIQVAFDAAGDARTAGYEVDDYEYGFGLTAEGPKAYRWVAGNNLPAGDVPTIEVAVVRDEAAATTRYEVAIPFKELAPFSPERGSCGMNLVVNDNDGGAAQRAWLEWTPGITGAKDPSAFGLLKLSQAAPSGTTVAASIVGQSDLSAAQEAAMALRLLLPEDMGEGRLTWRVVRTGEDPEEVQVGEYTAALPAGTLALPIAVEIDRLGYGRFLLSATVSRGADTLAQAEFAFCRFAVGELQERLQSIAARLDTGLATVDALRAGGAGAQYTRATLGAVEEFSRWAKVDLEAARYERADTVCGELETLLSEAEAELAALRADATGELRVPQMPAERLTVRDGAFYCGDRPQLLIGYAGWWEVWTSQRRLAAQGLNHLEDSIIAPFSLFPDAGEQPDGAMMDALRWAWQRAVDPFTCYSRMLACNQVPQSFRDAHPEATGGGWSGLCTLSPELRDLQTRYLKTVAETASAYASAGVYVLYGESTHGGPHHPLEIAAFAEYLQGLYGTLAALNEAWGTQYGEWEDIGTAQDVASSVAWHDRGRFNQQLFTQWTEWLQEQVRAVDPGALCTGYPSLLSWDDSSDWMSGIDMEALCRVLNVNGFDTAALDHGGSRLAMNSITGLAMPHDMLTAFNPRNPNYDPELHLVNLNRPYPEEYVRAAMFQGCLHGMSAASLWVYQRSEGMDSMLVFQPRVMAAYLRTALDLRRLVEPILAFQRAPAQAAILYSTTSVAYNPKHLAALKLAYEAGFFSDTKLGFVTERTIAEGALDDLRLLILPEASHVPANVYGRIRSWAAAGGELVTIGGCLSHDERDRPLPDGAQVPGAVTGPWSDDPVRLRAELEPILERSLSRPWRAVNARGELLSEVEMRTVKTESGRLWYAINMGKQGTELDLLPRPASPVVDLLSGRPVTLPLKLEPLGVVILSEVG